MIRVQTLRFDLPAGSASSACHRSGHLTWAIWPGRS